MGWPIFDVLTSVIEVFIYFWYVGTLAKRKYRFWTVGIGSFMFLATMYVCDFLKIGVSFKLLIILLTGAVAVRLLYEITWHKIIVASLVYLMSTIVSETAIMGILMGIHGFRSFQIFLSENTFRVQAFFMAKVIDMIILRISFRFLNPSHGRQQKKEIVLLTVQTFCFFLMMLLVVDISTEARFIYLIHPYWYSVVSLVCLVTYFISFQVSEWYFEIQREKEEHVKLDAYRQRKLQYYKIKREAQDDVRRIYHDLQNHLNIIAGMKEKNLDGLEQYIEDIKEQVEPYAKYHNSGNDVIDMVVLEKKELAEKSGITMEVRIEEGCIQQQNTFQLCTLFCNAIDNAIEATKQLDCLEKTIQIKVCRTSDGLSMLFQNPVNETTLYKILDRNGKMLTHVKNKARHGLGIGNMERAVKALGGRMKIDVVDKKFQLSVILSRV